MISAIVPKGPNIQDVKKGIDQGLLATVEDAKALFYMTYHNWENEPVFEVIGPRTKAGIREVVYQTTSTPYIWVANGTQPHKIQAKGDGFLKFQTGGRSKTRPGQFQSMVGSKGSEWKTAEQVDHPGIEKRNPQKEVAERVQSILVIAVSKGSYG